MSGFDADAIANEYMSRFQAIEASLVSKGMDADTAKDLAKEATRRSFEKEDIKANKAAPNLSQFTKFEDDISPETYLEQFYGELQVANLDTDENKMNFLPLLLKGRAAYYAETLRMLSSWGARRHAFIQEFTVDPNVIIGELRAQRCQDFDVDGFTNRFLQTANKLNKSDPGIEAQLKLLYVDSLPFKIKEVLLKDKYFQSMSFQQLMSEARRHSNVNNYLYKANKQQGDANKKQDQDNKQNNNRGGSWKDRKANFNVADIFGNH